MARRSSRLVSGGYYNSDEESDSSSVTNISYRETPVKVFKKKAGTRKSVSRTPSRANSNASSVGTETPITAGQYEAPPPSPLISESDPPMRTLPFLPSSTVTPRPPLTPSPSRTPLRYPSLPPERSLYSGLGCSIRPGLTSGAELKERTQSGVESSGYSSSEGPLLWKTPSNTRNTSKGPNAGYWGRIRGAFYSLMDSVSLILAALKSQIKHLPSRAASVSGRMKKVFALLLLFLIILLCVWLLLPLLTPLVSRMAVTESQTKPKSSPVLFTASPPLHQPNSIQPAHVVDPAVVSAAVEAKMQRLLDPAVVSAAVETKMQRLLGMKEESEEGSLLGTFTYDENGESTQTFKLPISSS
ncbi:SUN domain containing protein 1 [Dissostichus eleginoides]|uniref:SUN domain containing protein 1 n=1 Tax=Dissostichus eleginoides TaxID=100907 RepID=A0AAD9BM40_DISEL|nr:SUN domain containing protein 1 [Dissostichus eleginoides]